MILYRHTILPVLLTACLAALGCNGARTDAPVSTAASAFAPAFADATVEAGLDGFRHETGAAGRKWMPETTGSGGGFIDYDGDGWLDVLLVAGGRWPEDGADDIPALRLYRNQGDGTFRDVTAETGLERVHAYGMGVAAADYDGDGDEDVFLTTVGENLLLRNDAAPGAPQARRFTEVGRRAGVADHAAWSTAALFFDADRDGDLDLYVGNYVDWSPETDTWCSFDGQVKAYCTPEVYDGVASRFYVNDGDGRFTEAGGEAGIRPNAGKVLGVVETDFNRDGWPDLMVACDLEKDLLYVNDGDGTFTEKGLASGMAVDETGRARAGMGIDAGVVDGTGEVSMFVGNFAHEMIGVYRHMGTGLFTDRAAVSGIGRPSLPTLTFGLFLADVELDGDLDLFVANGHVQQEVEALQESVTYRQPPQLFLNGGDGTFTVAGGEGIPSEPLVARGAAYGDYDRDGDVDLLVTQNGGAARLYRNESQAGSSLRVRLEARESAPEGLGSRIVAFSREQRMERRIRTGSSFLSQSEKVATFGLGDRSGIDSLTVYWPSGQVDRLGPVSAGREIVVVEGEGRSASEGMLAGKGEEATDA